MEISQRARVLLRAAPLLFGAGFVAALAAFVVSLQLAPTYRAETTLLVGRLLTGPATGHDQILAAEALAETYAELATTRPILGRAAARAGTAGSVEDLADAVAVRRGSSGAVLVISAVRDSSRGAAALANAIAAELQSTGGSAAIDIAAAIAEDARAVTAEIERVAAEVALLMETNDPADADQLAVLEARLTTLRTARASLVSLSANVGSNTINVIEPAEPPSEPATPQPLAYTLLGGLAGVVLAVIFVLAVGEVRQRRGSS